MKRNLFIGAAFASGVLFLLSGNPVMAQAPGMPQPTMQPGRAGMPGTTPNTPGINSDTTQMKTKVDEKKFVQDAAMGGLTEVELGKLAAEKGSTDSVKEFGQKMVDDHTKANEELKKVASTESITIADSLDAKHQSRVDKLSKLSGPAFDKAYMKDQVKDHEQDVSEFQNEAQNGTQVEVKDFAAKTLPTIQGHLAMAKDIQKGKSTSASADRSEK
jgi:putative membrane protein